MFVIAKLMPFFFMTVFWISVPGVAAARKNGAIRAVADRKDCEGVQVSARFAGNFCEALFYLRPRITPIQDLNLLTQDAAVVFLGDTHPNTLIKTWLARNLGRFKELGFTHVALEALNSESQGALDSYLRDSRRRAQMVKLIADDWGWIPEEHVKLIDAIHAAGLEIIAIDNRNELDRAGLGNDIQKRNLHMTEQILDVLSKPRAGRIVVLTGKLHSAWRSEEAGIQTLPAMLHGYGITSLSYDVESGEEPVPRNTTQAFFQDLGAGKLQVSLNGEYFLPTPVSDSAVNGVLFISR